MKECKQNMLFNNLLSLLLGRFGLVGRSVRLEVGENEKWKSLSGPLIVAPLSSDDCRPYLHIILSASTKDDERVCVDLATTKRKSFRVQAN